MSEFTREFARLTIVDATGEIYPRDVDVTGPIVEQEKALRWATAQIERDGGKVKAVVFGTKQAGYFRQEQRRRTPLFQGGYRRMAAFLR